MPSSDGWQVTLIVGTTDGEDRGRRERSSAGAKKRFLISVFRQGVDTCSVPLSASKVFLTIYLGLVADKEVGKWLYEVEGRVGRITKCSSYP